MRITIFEVSDQPGLKERKKERKKKGNETLVQALQTQTTLLATKATKIES